MVTSPQQREPKGDHSRSQTLGLDLDGEVATQPLGPAVSRSARVHLVRSGGSIVSDRGGT
jgi:hypothetical protein